MVKIMLFSTLGSKQDSRHFTGDNVNYNVSNEKCLIFDSNITSMRLLCLMILTFHQPPESLPSMFITNWLIIPFAVNVYYFKRIRIISRLFHFSMARLILEHCRVYALIITHNVVRDCEICCRQCEITTSGQQRIYEIIDGHSSLKGDIIRLIIIISITSSILFYTN